MHLLLFLLLMVVPGYVLLSLVSQLKNQPLFFKILLSPALSVGAVLFWSAVLNGGGLVDRNNLLLPVYATFVMALVLGIVALVLKIVTKSSGDTTSRLAPLEWLGIVFPAGVFFLRFGLNPAIQDQDGSQYIRIFMQLEGIGRDVSYLYPRRFGFTNLIMSLHEVGHLDYLDLFIFIIPLVIWLSIPAWIALADRLINNKTTWWLASLILASATVTGHIDRTKPESIILLLSVPFLVLLNISIRRKSVFSAGLAALLLLGALRTHDTGILLVVPALMTILIVMVKWVIAKDTRVRLGQVLLVGLPYLLLVKPWSLVGILYAGLSQFVTKLGFYPWFLSGIQSGGSQLAWPGYSFILYYTLNALVVALTASWLLRRLFREPITYTPLITHFILYVAVAEVFPRFGIAILPDRAWNHIILSSILIIVAGIHQLPRIARLVLQVALGVGVVASSMIGLLSGSLVNREEMRGVLPALKSLESDAVILSTQRFNDPLVVLYGKKNFGYITNLSSDSVISDSTLSESKIVPGDSTPQFVSIVTQRVVASQTEVIGGVVLRADQQVLSNTSYEVPLNNSQEQLTSGPRYFLYSFSKTEGLLARLQRPFWIAGIDKQRSEQMHLLVNQRDPRIVYAGSDAILLKL